MSSSAQQEILTASQGPNITADGGSFLDRAYEYGASVMTWLKALTKWSLVCEEAAQREQTQIEKIIGTTGHDPTAPSDLHPVSETVMFDSATIMATLIITFCIFYFIDFFVQLFAGFSVLGADISPSLASIPTVIPTRTRKRRRTGSSMSRETVSTQPTSTITRLDTTQGTVSTTSTSSAVPMKDILTKGFKSNLSRESGLSTAQKQTRMSGEMNTDEINDSISGRRDIKMRKSMDRTASSEKLSKPSSAPKVSSDRKLAGRSPTDRRAHITYAADVSSKRAEVCGERTYGFDEDFSTYVPTSERKFAIKEKTQMQVCKRKVRDYVYDEDCELEYAEDLSGEEFDINEYVDCKTQLECEARLDELRSEFSVDDDIEDLERFSNECESVENSASEKFPKENLSPLMRREDDLESLYNKAEDIFNLLSVRNQGRKHVEETGDKIKVSPDCRTAKIAEFLSAQSETLSPQYHKELERESQGVMEGEYGLRNEEFEYDAAIQHESVMEHDSGLETKWEQPRSLNLSDNYSYKISEDSLLRECNDIKLLEGSKAVRSLSVFSVRQSMELRKFHHVLFTYPDPSAEKVLLTGSFFGWKMSLPMQREGNVFRLSLTLPGGVHQYRFQVHRRSRSQY